MSWGPVAVPTFEVQPETKAAALTTFDEGIYSEAGRKFFDCTHPDQPYISGSALRTGVIDDRYRLEMTWPTAGLPPEFMAYGSSPRVMRIACGADGFVAWISGKGATQRIVIADTLWRAVGAFDFQVPEIPQDSGIHILNFRQSEDTVLMEFYVEGNGKSGPPPGSVILTKITHPLLASDYGGAARSWPSILSD